MTQVFQMVPAPARSLWILAVIAVVLVLVVGLLGYIAWSSQHVRFEVSSAGLRIVGDLFGRRIPINELIADQAAHVDWSRSPDCRPRLRTFGTGLPGYGAGWFRLKNGEKALLFVTDPRKVVRIPTTGGYTIMLSVQEPANFIQALRQAAGRG